LTYETLPTTTFVPNTIYYSNTFIQGSSINLIFDAEGDSNAQFFIISEQYIEFTVVNMVLEGGAEASNIFWLANTDYITFSQNKATGEIVGNYIANSAFSLFMPNLKYNFLHNIYENIV